MSKKVLKEAFEWSVQKIKKKDGSDLYKIIIDTRLSNESSYEHKDKIKSYGANWDNTGKYWFFWASGDKTKIKNTIDKSVKPCIEYLKSVETKPSSKNTEETIIEILRQIDVALTTISSTTTKEVDAIDVKDLKDKLKTLKLELIESFKDGSFKEKMEPFLRFRRAQGPGFSILNSILVWLQRPQATLVKSASNWKSLNREVKSNAIPIALFVPIGKKIYNTKEERDNITSEYIKSVGKKTENELTPGEKETLKKKLNAVNASKFELMPRFYDLEDTEQIEGAQDLIGNQKFELDWFDNGIEETPKTIALYDAVIKTISSKLTLKFVPEKDLDGARGVSKGGTIEVIQNCPKSVGSISTLVHEFAHELLHQSYLKKESNEYAQYFVGRAQGRALIEQQAEICAWIVMRAFGYSMDTARNYAANWGADENSAVLVFDTVANVASYIINEIHKNSNIANMNESLGGFVITGFDVAKLLGPEAIRVYMRGKELENEDNDLAMDLSPIELQETIFKVVNRFLSESKNYKI